MFKKLAQSLQYRLLHKKGWLGGKKILRQSDLFIMPNHYGFYMAFLIMSGFGIGYRVQNNFILMGVIFLFLLFMLSLISAARNLQGMHIQISANERYFAHHDIHITCRFKKPNPAYNISLLGGLAGAAAVDLSSGLALYRLPISPLGRGQHSFPPLTLQTRFPFGIVRCWTRLAPPIEILVAPVPDERALSAYPRIDPQIYFARETRQGASHDVEEWQDPRQYQDGDLPSRIDWKRFAANRELLIREFETSGAGDVLLQMPKDMPREAGLSYLCGGLCVSERAGLNVVMRLDERDYYISTKQQFDEAFHVLASS